MEKEMEEIKYRIKKIRDEKEFDSFNRLLDSGIQLIDTKSGLGGMDLYEARFNYIKPGIAGDGTMVLELTVTFPSVAKHGTMDIFGKSVLYALDGVFQTGNILAAVFMPGTTEAAFLIFPLAGRKLDPDRWIDRIHHDQPESALKAAIEKSVNEVFPELKETSSAGKKDITAQGYQEALMNFKPHPYKKEDDCELPWDTREADSQDQSEIPYDQLKDIKNKTITYYTLGPEHLLFEKAQRGDPDVTPKKFMKHVENYLIRSYRNVGEHDRGIILRAVYRAVYQNYILEPLINDEAISDIKVIAPDKIRVKVGGERYTSNLRFIDENDYWRFVRSLAIRNNLDIAHDAISVFSDTRTNPNFRMRFNITMPEINSVEWPYLHIRKIAKKKRGLDYLINAGMLDQKIADYLVDQARYGKGMIFTGKGASGKTSLMNALIDKIPFDKSVLVIQESEELFSDVHPDIMFQHVVNNGRGGQSYDLQDEARNGLLTDLDYFIIGEVKGSEAKYFINAADTGHRCWCSVHSPSSLDAIDKLADYVMYETKYSKEEATYMLKDLGCVIYMKNFKVYEISEIEGFDFEHKKLIYKPIYRRPIIGS